MQESPVETGSKDKLRRAALHCIAQSGYAATSSRDIAREAGANVASINYHFGSKEALVTEALGECFGMWNQRVETAFVGAAGLPPHDQLAAILHAAIDTFDEVRSSVHACVETYAPALRSNELRERLAAGYATVRESAVQLAATAMQGGQHAGPGQSRRDRVRAHGSVRRFDVAVDRRPRRSPEGRQRHSTRPRGALEIGKGARHGAMR